MQQDPLQRSYARRSVSDSVREPEKEWERRIEVRGREGCLGKFTLFNRAILNARCSLTRILFFFLITYLFAHQCCTLQRYCSSFSGKNHPHWSRDCSGDLLINKINSLLIKLIICDSMLVKLIIFQLMSIRFVIIIIWFFISYAQLTKVTNVNFHWSFIFSINRLQGAERDIAYVSTL